jgi:hypothetical protein
MKVVQASGCRQTSHREGLKVAMKITVELDQEQATALLAVLRRIGPSEVALLHEGIEWATFDTARERLRIALRDVVEPGSRE